MIDAFLCSVLDVLGLSLIESRPLGWVPFRGSLFSWVIYDAFDPEFILLSRFVPVGDLLLCAKHLSLLPWRRDLASDEPGAVQPLVRKLSRKRPLASSQTASMRKRRRDRVLNSRAQLAHITSSIS